MPNKEPREEDLRPNRGGNVDDREDGPASGGRRSGGGGGYSNRPGGVDATPGGSGTDAPGFGNWARQSGCGAAVPGSEGVAETAPGTVGRGIATPEALDRETSSPNPQRPDDATLTARVRERLAGHPSVDASRIEISSRDGIVTLRGTVANARLRRLIEDAVAAVPDVDDVANELAIWTGERPRDRAAQSESRAVSPDRPEDGPGTRGAET